MPTRSVTPSDAPSSLAPGSPSSRAAARARPSGGEGDSGAAVGEPCASEQERGPKSCGWSYKLTGGMTTCGFDEAGVGDPESCKALCGSNETTCTGRASAYGNMVYCGEGCAGRRYDGLDEREAPRAHDALAWRVDAWARTVLDARANARIDRARDAAFDALAASLADPPVEGLGLPSPADARALFAAFTRDLLPSGTTKRVAPAHAAE